MTDPNQFDEFENNEAASDQLPYESDGLFDQLASEEPPIEVDDTNPSATKPRPAVNLGEGKLGLGSIAMVLTALLMVAVGALLILGEEDKPTENTNPTQVVDQTEATVTLAPSLTPPQSVSPPPLPTDASRNTTSYATAAVDEQGLSLLTPVPANNGSSGSIERDDGAFTDQIGGAQNDFVVYTVKGGDTLESIRERFNIELCTIVWSNERNKVSPLRPGNELVIPPENGVYAKIRETLTIAQLATETGVDPYHIIDSPYNNVLFDAQPDSILLEGLQVMVPGGNGGNCNIWGEGPSVISGGEGEGGNGEGPPTNNTGTYSLWGCTANVAGGGFPAANPMGGRYVFFQGFSPAHTGVDLSADEGLPVLAAGYGTVVFAGWNQYGYGNTVVIAHGTTFTLYAHMSALNVSCGQDVNGGQSIGSVGNTGNSSGSHLHFEIRDAGFNPLNPVYTIGF